MRPFILFAALLATMALGACSTAQDELGSCSAGCDPGEACDPGTAQCLPQIKAAPSLEVLPPSGNNQGWVQQEFPSPTLRPDGSVSLQLDPAVSLEGGVYASHDMDRIVPAQVIAWRDSLIEGRPRVQLETATNAAKGQREKYVLWLNPGFKYMFFVAPLPPFDERYPPLVIPSLEITDHTKRDFVLDGDDRAVLVTGMVRNYAGGQLSLRGKDKDGNEEALIDEKGEPLASQVRVRAFETDGLLRSTTATTEPADGSFGFRVPAGVASYTVRVDTAPGAVPIPTLECRSMVLGLAPSKTGGQPTQAIKDIRLPSFSLPKVYRLTVRGKDGTPVKGASVTFETPVQVLGDNPAFESCTARYRRTASSNTQGEVKILLLPGSSSANVEYAVTVVSPAESPYASQWIPKREVGPHSGQAFMEAIELGQRYEISGTVVREDTGQPVEGVTIDADGVSPGGETVKLPSTSASTTTDGEGTYRFYVDPGVYNIDLRPPESSGLPTVGLTAKVEASVRGKRFVIPAPKVILGQVRDPTGQPLPAAAVRFFELMPETEKPLTHKATLRASALSGPDGLFGLLLARPPE